MDRREFLRSGAIVGAAGLAGCTGMFDTQSDGGAETETETTRSRGQFTTVADRDQRVYHPTHAEGATRVGSTESGRYAVALMYSFPHSFWTITGTDTNLAEAGDDATVHLMATVWDAETGTVLPTANVSAEILKDGETVDSRNLWPMLSQNMGYHFGDNVTLDGDGTYTAELEIGAMQARGMDALQGAFDELTTVEVEFDHDRSAVADLPYERFPDEQGSAGALAPMSMDGVPVAQVPARDALPGTVVADGASGDADFPVFVPDETPGFVDADRYLAVSPRTPYNRYPLPFMGLSATLDRGGETVYDDRLRPAVDPDIGYHYGAGVDGVEAGDALALTVDAPPGVARHEGYETAFVEMPPMELELSV